MSLYVYVQKIEGGVGLIGTNSVPTLIGNIQSKFGYSNDINGSILGKHISSGQTETIPYIYTELIPGGMGIFQASKTPDLHGYIVSRLFEGGNKDLSGRLLCIRSGTLDLDGYIRPSFPDSLDISGSLVGYFAKDLTGNVFGLGQGIQDISGSLEAVPPAALIGNLQGYDFLGLSGTVECVEPSVISGYINTLQRTDLGGSLVGYKFVDLFGNISGTYAQDLLGTIFAYSKDTLDISGSLRGILGKYAQSILHGYLVGSTSGTSSISGSVYGFSCGTLSGAIQALFSEQLFGELNGDMPGGLSGSIDPKGDVNTLQGYLYTDYSSSLSLTGTIDGTAISSLEGHITTDTPILIGEITPIYVPTDILKSTVQGISIDSITGSIEPNFKDLLSGTIEPIETPELFGKITPRVFYIDAYLPINTYPFNELKAVINSNYCDCSSSFSDVGAIIKGTYPAELVGSLIATAGQYVIASDQLNILLENNIEIADWIFFIAEPPAYASNYCTLILVNSPLLDLSGFIEGVYNSSSLSGSIVPKYIPPVSRQGVELGELVNTKTGDRKLVRIGFRGNAQNFYYSSENNITYSEYSNDFLEIIVETYKKVGSSDNSLLTQKVQSRKCYVNKLDSFKSIDSAIKYGILCAAGEISQELYGYIEAIGTVDTLKADISCLDPRKVKSLSGTIIPVGNIPDIQGSIESKGTNLDITGHIKSKWEGSPYSEFFDTDGKYYKPSLFYSGGQYSVILTKTEVSGTLGLSKPSDLFVVISGVAEQYLEATVTGIL